jgi:hypothetical protein
MRLNFKVQPGIGYYGYFDGNKNEITLCTADEQVFLHELSHAIDQKVGNYDNKDYDGGEIVAELSACFLASIYAKKADMQFHLKHNNRCFCISRIITLPINKNINTTVHPMQ